MISTTGAAVNTPDSHHYSNPNALRSGRSAVSAANKASDDAKLIFGTVFSLRNMVRKLGGEDDAFISYRTAQYKLHYYETASNLRFVMLTDTGTLSMRNVMHQIYINLWCEYGEFVFWRFGPAVLPRGCGCGRGWVREGRGNRRLTTRNSGQKPSFTRRTQRRRRRQERVIRAGLKSVYHGFDVRTSSNP